MNDNPLNDRINHQPSEGPPLRLVFWETTAGCNLACVHCRRLEVSTELTKNDLTTAEGCQLIEQIAQVGRPVLVFSGGEPLMRPDLFELANHAKYHDLLIALATNGTMIDQPLAKRIADTGFDRVSISLDGADAQTHDRFRGLKGSYDQARRALELLNEAGVPTQVNCTIAQHNKNQIDQLIELGEGLGAVAVHYFLLVPVGCGQEIAEDQMLSSEEVEERLGRLYELEQKTELQIKATCAPHYYRILKQRGGRPKERHPTPTGHPAHGSLHSTTRGCLAGTAVCFVSHQGEVFPCGYLPIEAGNVRLQSFAEIWKDNNIFNALRKPQELIGKCGRCEYKMVCGGCRARAFYEFGDYLAEEPYCAYEPKLEQ